MNVAVRCLVYMPSLCRDRIYKMSAERLEVLGFGKVCKKVVENPIMLTLLYVFIRLIEGHTLEITEFGSTTALLSLFIM